MNYGSEFNFAADCEEYLKRTDDKGDNEEITRLRMYTHRLAMAYSELYGTHASADSERRRLQDEVRGLHADLDEKYEVEDFSCVDEPVDIVSQHLRAARGPLRAVLTNPYATANPTR